MKEEFINDYVRSISMAKFNTRANPRARRDEEEARSVPQTQTFVFPLPASLSPSWFLRACIRLILHQLREMRNVTSYFSTRFLKLSVRM